MVLPNGKHVKFGPIAWTPAVKDIHLYPQTTQVSGKCNQKIDHHEDKWEWVECAEPWQDLWSAVRGGGGGTFGVLILSWWQLHDDNDWLQVAINGTVQSELNQICATESNKVVVAQKNSCNVSLD